MTATLRDLDILQLATIACMSYKALCTCLQESLSATAGAASSAAEAASASLPEPVRDALSAAKGPVSQAVSQVGPSSAR